MGRRADYVAQLTGASDEVAFLREHSGLPGPRANLELVQAAADVGDEPRFRQWITLGSGTGPTDEFLAVCGVVGLGRLVAEGRKDLLAELREHATDSRWRIREAVAMALQRLGDADVSFLLQVAVTWAEDRGYVQRAAIASVSEPRLLKTEAAGRTAIDVVDRVTALFAERQERRANEARVLRQALGYCWSVVVVGNPRCGRPRFEQLARSADPDFQWIARENLKKARLVRLDSAWVDRLRSELLPRT